MRRTVPAAVLAAAALAAALAPLADAEHVYSHRYLLGGRIVDADGDPVAGVTIPYGFTGFSGGLCGVPQLPVTNAYGDFAYCFHTHDLHDGDQIVFALDGREVRRDVDLDSRWTFTHVTVTNESAGKAPPDDFRRRLDVGGKVWQATAPGALEGVYVRGVAVADANVTMTAHDAGSNVTLAATDATDAFGEFAFTVTFPENVTTVTVRLAALGEDVQIELSPPFLRARQDVRIAGNATHPLVAPAEPPEPNPWPPPPAEPPLDNVYRFPDNDKAPAQTVSSVEAPGGTPPFRGPAVAFTVLALSGGGIGILLWVLAKREDPGQPPG